VNRRIVVPAVAQDARQPVLIVEPSLPVTNERVRLRHVLLVELAPVDENAVSVPMPPPEAFAGRGPPSCSPGWSVPIIGPPQFNSHPIAVDRS
jgi:hypothetical protein